MPIVTHVLCLCLCHGDFPLDGLHLTIRTTGKLRSICSRAISNGSLLSLRSRREALLLFIERNNDDKGLLFLSIYYDH
jgi:hypothetical protein